MGGCNKEIWLPYHAMPRLGQNIGWDKTKHNPWAFLDTGHINDIAHAYNRHTHDTQPWAIKKPTQNHELLLLPSPLPTTNQHGKKVVACITWYMTLPRGYFFAWKWRKKGPFYDVGNFSHKTDSNKSTGVLIICWHGSFGRFCLSGMTIGPVCVLYRMYTGTLLFVTSINVNYWYKWIPYSYLPLPFFQTVLPSLYHILHT